jgi:magnesium chelatase family protein
LLDRVELRLTVHPPTRADLALEGETSAVVAARVRQARDRAAERLRGTAWRTNAEVPGRELRRGQALPAAAAALVEREVSVGRLTLRGADRVLRISWTLADLAGRDRPGVDEVHGALGLRRMATPAA